MDGKWMALYRFSLTPIDSCAALSDGTYLAPQPVMIRDSTLFVARVSRRERRFLQVDETVGGLYRHLCDGVKVEERELTSWDEVRELLLTRFPPMSCAVDEIGEHVSAVFTKRSLS
jgi:hypothetical protein